VIDPAARCAAVIYQPSDAGTNFAGNCLDATPGR